MTDPIAAHLAAVRRDRYSDATLTARARILATLPDPLGMDRLATLAWWESRQTRPDGLPLQCRMPYRSGIAVAVDHSGKSWDASSATATISGVTQYIEESPISVAARGIVCASKCRAFGMSFGDSSRLTTGNRSSKRAPRSRPGRPHAATTWPDTAGTRAALPTCPHRCDRRAPSDQVYPCTHPRRHRPPWP